MNRILFSFLLVLSFSSCDGFNDLFGKDDDDLSIGPVNVVTEDGQLYNMDFDLWSKKDSNDVCYGADASANQKMVWGSANESTSSLGKPTCVPDSVFVAVEGVGKHAVKLKTQIIKAVIVKKLAAGCIFTGKMGRTNYSKMTATLKWGIPFTLRPKSLEGYACYKPKVINMANSPYTDRKGSLDSGHVFVLLTDWDQQFTVDPGKDAFVDIDNDPHIIGYGKVTFDSTMVDYEKFTINIEYRNERTPKYVVIVGSSSALGDYFTGGEGSTLYLDEFRFLY